MSIFLDFDGTITVQDTIGEIAKFALGFRARQGDDLKEEWAAVVKAYLDDYNKYVEEYRPQEEKRQLPAEEVDFLRQMKAVELDSLARINTCHLFRGISPDTFRDAGRNAVSNGVIKIRPGFMEFVDMRTKEGWKIWIISVNWSSAFIEGVCNAPGIHTIANDVKEDGTVIGPDILRGEGLEPRNLTNSCDKLDVMKSVLQEESLETKPTIYFGDSITDLECLLAATFGVVVSDKNDSKLLETLKRIGKQVPRAGTDQSISWASTFHEVMDQFSSLSS